MNNEKRFSFLYSISQEKTIPTKRRHGEPRIVQEGTAFRETIANPPVVALRVPRNPVAIYADCCFGLPRCRVEVERASGWLPFGRHDTVAPQAASAEHFTDNESAVTIDAQSDKPQQVVTGHTEWIFQFASEVSCLSFRGLPHEWHTADFATPVLETCGEDLLSKDIHWHLLGRDSASHVPDPRPRLKVIPHCPPGHALGLLSHSLVDAPPNTRVTEVVTRSMALHEAHLLRVPS